MRCVPCVILAILAGCASPTPQYSGPPARLQVDGHSFSVFSDRSSAQVVRTNRAFLPNANEVIAAAALAAEQATGCTANRAKLKGDTAIVTVPLTCD